MGVFIEISTFSACFSVTLYTQNEVDMYASIRMKEKDLFDKLHREEKRLIKKSGPFINKAQAYEEED